MPYDTHKGLLKVGEATLTTDIKPDGLVPNCRTLNQAAIARIKSYTDTQVFPLNFSILSLQLSKRLDIASLSKDKEVHKV
jgi:hypothetical protein